MDGRLHSENVVIRPREDCSPNGSSGLPLDECAYCSKNVESRFQPPDRDALQKWGFVVQI